MVFACLKLVWCDGSNDVLLKCPMKPGERDGYFGCKADDTRDEKKRQKARCI